MSGARVPTPQASTGELIAQATDDISTLIRSEIQLAKEDLATSGKRLGIGVGMFGVAGTLALYGVGAFAAAAILGVAEALDAWLAALIVGAGLFVVAGLAGLVGRMRMGRVAEAPRKADVAAARHEAAS
jgi:hypothetical protein